MSFDRLAGLVDVADLALGDVADRESGGAGAHQDALALEVEEGLPDRGARDVDLVRDPLLHDAFAGLERACEHRVEHLPVDLVGEPPAVGLDAAKGAPRRFTGTDAGRVASLGHLWFGPLGSAAAAVLLL